MGVAGRDGKVFQGEGGREGERMFQDESDDATLHVRTLGGALR